MASVYVRLNVCIAVLYDAELMSTCAERELTCPLYSLLGSFAFGFAIIALASSSWKSFTNTPLQFQQHLESMIKSLKYFAIMTGIQA